MALFASPVVRVIYHGKKYDVPRGYVDEEDPGGADTIYPYEGQDMTEAFVRGHSEEGAAMLEQWRVLTEDEAAQPADDDNAA